MIAEIKEITVGISATLRDVLVTLNNGRSGIALVVDDQGVMQGLFTEGDVRKVLLKGASLSEAAQEYMNRQFTAGSADKSREENLALMSETICLLPILDSQGKPVDLISWPEIWRLPVMSPSLGGNEMKYVTDCIASNWISSQGKYVTRFEEEFRSYVGSNHALCTSNGTTALHLALVALGIKPGDEVLVPDLTFAAPANVVIHCGAKPILVDVDRDTWTIDPNLITAKITEKTKAIIPVHLYGHSCNMEPILEIAKKHHLFVIEDCAEALGAEYKNQKVGTLGDVGCFSFFANKVITTGEGGMVTTNDRNLYQKMMILRDHGMTKERRYWHLYPGFNYRMTNLQAAIGLAQIERIEKFLNYRQKVVERYHQQLSEIKGLTLPPDAEWGKNVYWLYSIILDQEKTGIDRNKLADRLASYGVDTRPFFYSLHIQPPYQEYAKGDYPVSTYLSEQGISLPTANDISLKDVDRVCTLIKAIVSNSVSADLFQGEDNYTLPSESANIA